VATQFKVGDRVKVLDGLGRQYNGVAFTVDRILPKNVLLKRVDNPRGQGLRIDPAYLEALPSDWDPSTVGVPYRVVTDAPLPMGAVVSVKLPKPNPKMPEDLLYVVLQDRQDGTVKVCRLGGDGDRYWPKIPRAWLTEVPVVEINREGSEQN
jgi:hypothetical protein